MRLCAWAGQLELTLGTIGWSALLAVAVAVGGRLARNSSYGVIMRMACAG